MMNALTQAFAFDIHIRRDVDERFPGEGIQVRTYNGPLQPPEDLTI
ncbi:MAG: hypothetical protein Q3M30_03050 [Candidatus Electrothrix sp. Rat3]|nr:hypothetical protein [Candidatus Electrothrix rattekaaiensis]